MSLVSADIRVLSSRSELEGQYKISIITYR